MPTTDGGAICERCGARARVHITSERTGSHGMRHLCFDCAEAERPVRQRRKSAFNLGAVCLAVGALFVLLSVFADQLALGDSQGFGAWQTAGLVAAISLIGVGAALRIPTILVIGCCGGLLSVLADKFKLGGAPGFGLGQTTGIVAGSALIVLGIVIAVMRKRWAARVQRGSSSITPD